MATQSFVRKLAVLLALVPVFASGCIENVEHVRFEGTPKRTVRLLHAELDHDGGSPQVAESTSYQLSKTTVGRNFLKSNASSGSFRFRGGIYQP